MSKNVNLPWLEKNTVLLVRHGSHAYGTNIETSDIDEKGVAVPPLNYFLGFSKKFEQAESKEPDSVIYDVRKFFSLAAQCNPNIIEVLFVDDSDVLRITLAGQMLRSDRHLFLSQKAKHTFSGYAISQLKRIRSHRRWLLDPPKAPPQRADFGLPEQERDSEYWNRMNSAKAAVQKVVDSWSIDWSGVERDRVIEVTNRINDFLSEVGYTTSRDLEDPAARSLGLDDASLEVLRRERLFREAQREWTNYETWRRERNPARQELEARHGYDTKHGMHLVRLMRMCREIVSEGRVIVRRPDAEELLSIRHGAWEYDRLVEWAEQQGKEIQGLLATSPLPKTPDIRALDDLCERVCLVQLLDGDVTI